MSTSICANRVRKSYLINDLHANQQQRTAEAAKTARAGGDLPLQARIVSNAREVGDHVLHVELLNPAGRAQEYYTRNMLAPDGRLELSIALALNEQPGAWVVRVRDVLTGQTAERTVVIAPR